MTDVPDRVAWMRQNRRFNIAITGAGFADDRLEEYFEDEPAWIIAPVIQFEDFLRLLGFIGLRTMLPKQFEPGFKEYRVSEGQQRYVFRVWNPGKIAVAAAKDAPPPPAAKPSTITLKKA